MVPKPVIYAAAVTPRGTAGEIDFGAAFELIDFLCRSGVSGIALFTAAGEYGALAAGDRSRLTYLAVKRSRVPLLAGVGTATLDESVTLGREARDAGAAGLLLPPPYFFRYEQDDLREYYLQFAAQVEGVRTYISRTAELDANTAAELMETGRFAGVEEAGGDCAGAARWTRNGLVGEDRCVRSGLAAGAGGAVSAAAGAIPEVAMALAGGEEQAATLFDEFVERLARAPRTAMLKAAVSARGLKTGAAVVVLTPEKARRVAEFAEWFRAWVPGVVKGRSAGA